MLLKYFTCLMKSNDSKSKFKRENTPYPRQSVIDVDKGTIEQNEIKIDDNNVDYEYISNSSILHCYKKQ